MLVNTRKYKRTSNKKIKLDESLTNLRGIITFINFKERCKSRVVNCIKIIGMIWINFQTRKSWNNSVIKMPDSLNNNIEICSVVTKP